MALKNRHRRNRQIARCSVCKRDYDVVSATSLYSYQCDHRKYHLCNGRMVLEPAGRRVDYVFYELILNSVSDGTYVATDTPRVESIDADAARRRSVWFKEKNRKGRVELYTTCFACGRINRNTGIRISRDGITECYHCVCSIINRHRLLGWSGTPTPSVIFDTRLISKMAWLERHGYP